MAVTLIGPRADIDGVALDLDLVREATMHAVEAQQVRVGLDGAEIVDGHDLDVGPTGFDDGPEGCCARCGRTR